MLRPEELVRAEYSHVWAVLASREGHLAPISLELLAAARELADRLGERAEGVLLGLGIAPLAQEAIERGADGVLLVEGPQFSEYHPEVHLQALSEAMKARRPEIVLLPANGWGEELAPRLAQRLRSGYLPACQQLEVDVGTRRLLGVRSAYGGKLLVTERALVSPQLATLLPGWVEPYPPDAARQGQAESVQVASAPTRLRLVQRLLQEVPPARRRILLVGGRGLGDREGFEKLRELAEALKAEVRASRGAIQAGLASAEAWVGSVQERFDVCISCGVAGHPIDYLSLAQARHLVALHRDPAAPILDQAELALVGEPLEILSSLAEHMGEQASH